MGRNNDRDRGTNTNSKRIIKDDKRRPGKKKVIIVREGAFVDYKDINMLRKFMSDRGKIRSRRVSGLSVQMQRDIAVAIKTARELALLPYATRTVSEGRGPRGGRGPRRDKDAPANGADVNEDTAADAGDDDDDDAEEVEA
jgi:small subunit ribosomal protein S18